MTKRTIIWCCAAAVLACSPLMRVQADDSQPPIAPTDVSQPASTAPSTTQTSGLVFRGDVVETPDGRDVGKVYATDPDRSLKPKTVVEIPADILPGWTKEKRAEAVADRLNKAYKSNPTFYENLVDTIKNNEVVLSYNNAGDFIITADRKSAEMNNFPESDTHDYAKDLIAKLRQMLSDPSVRDAKFDYQLSTPEEKRDRAVAYRQQADISFSNNDLDKAEALYQRAVLLSPEYDYCHLQLAGLYIKEGKKDDARTQLDAINKAALSTDDLTCWNGLNAKL